MRARGRGHPAEPAPPPDAPLPAVRISRALLVGAAGIALPILLHAILLPVLGEGTTPLFVVFLLSLLPAAGAAFVCAGHGMLRIGYAMCIVVGAAFVSLSLHEARIFGTVPSLDAAAAPSRPAAAGFLLPQAAPRADLAREASVAISAPRRDMRGRSIGRMTLRGRFTVVPVVGPDWTPAQPVPVVAVLDHGPDGVIRAVPAAPWDEGRGVLRLLPDQLRDRAVQEALKEAGWTAAPHIVVGRWVADPRWARLDAARPILLLFAAALLGLALVILSRHPRIAARLDPVMEGPPPGGSLPVGRAILQGIAALTLPSLLVLALRHAEVDPGVMFLAIGFAVVPSLMVTIGGSGATTPIGVLILGVILVVFVPLAVAARGATPNGGLPSLAGARWADVQEALVVLGVGWLAWAVLVIVGRVLEGRGGAGASR
jgi:hypothetical protein